MTVLAENVALPERTMYPENSISGVIQLSNANPAPAGAGQVVVTANTRSRYDAPWILVPGVSSTTDSAGRYTLEGLPPGTYSLNAKWVGSPAGQYEDIAERLTITISAGRTAEVATGLDLPHLGTIAGRIFLGNTSTPAPAGSVTVDFGYMGHFQTSRAVNVTAGGYYTLTGVPEGTWVVRAQYTGSGGWGYGFSNELTFFNNVSGFNLTLAPRAGFTGTITDSDGDPLEGIDVELVARVSDGEVYAGVSHATTNAQGKYSFRDLDAGYYSIQVDEAGWAYRVWPGYGAYYEPGWFSLDGDTVPHRHRPGTRQGRRSARYRDRSPR